MVRIRIRMRPVGLVTVLLMLGVAAAALAHRPASRSEASAMIYNASGRYYGNTNVSEPRSVPMRCFKAVVSTVGADASRWGAWGFSSYAVQPAHQSQCHVGDGIAILHRIGNRWYVYWEGSEGYPPTRNTRMGSFTERGVPRAVAKDLEDGLR